MQGVVDASRWAYNEEEEGEVLCSVLLHKLDN